MAIPVSTISSQLEDDGYVVLRGVLDVDCDLQPVEQEYAGILDRLAHQWQAEGLISAVHHELPFCERLCRLLEQADVPFDRHFDISLPQSGLSEQTPIHNGPAIFQLLRSPRVLDAVEQVIGPEIYNNPVQHTRIKLPAHCLGPASRTDLTGDVGWHQDLAVVTEDADSTDLLTVWIPMTRATEEMGCLAVVPGSHRELAHHCRSTDPRTLDQLSIPPQLVGENWRPLPMEPGDLLLMHRRMQHRGLPNTSDQVRWSFDLRYQPTGQPTGRRWFPGFVARSRSNPDAELTDHQQWADDWHRTRTELALGDDVRFNRWVEGDPACA